MPSALSSVRSLEAASSSGLPRALDEARFAVRELPAYRELLRVAGLLEAPLADLSAFRRLPFTDKSFFRSNFPAGVIAETSRVPSALSFRSQSSGTAGDRLVTLAPSFLLAQRMHATIGVHPKFSEFFRSGSKRRACRYAAPNCSDVECATPESTVADRTLRDGTLVLPVKHDLLSTPTAMVDQAIDELVAFAPDWLYVDPTHLAFLARRVRRSGVVMPRVGVIAMTYTPCTRVAHRQIARAFDGAARSNVLSMSELGWIGMECDHGALHLNDESFFLELLVGDRTARTGELAELVVTSLGDRLSPHVRYRTGDFYRATGEPCRCGHPFPVVRHEGRLRDMIVRGGRIILTPAGLDECVGAAPTLDVYRLHQHDDRRFTFYYVPNGRFEPADEERLERLLRERLGEGVELELDATQYIAGDRTGKFNSCTSTLSVGGAAEAAYVASR